jgi:hypothetical protein
VYASHTTTQSAASACDTSSRSCPPSCPGPGCPAPCRHETPATPHGSGSLRARLIGRPCLLLSKRQSRAQATTSPRRRRGRGPQRQQRQQPPRLPRAFCSRRTATALLLATLPRASPDAPSDQHTASRLVSSRVVSSLRCAAFPGVPRAPGLRDLLWRSRGSCAAVLSRLSPVAAER